jgi:hypothetical protein
MISLKPILNKALSLALVIILCLAPALSVGALAVNYPEGVTQADCEAAIPKLDKVIPAAVAMTGKSLDETFYGAVITDAALNGLFKSVYSEMAGNASTLNLMGVNVSPAALSAALASYPAVSQKIGSLTSLEEVLSVCDSFQWGVSTKNGFASAVAAMFAPFNSLLNAILCGGTARINILLSVRGDDGYGNTVVPLLNVLNCPSVMSSADFAAAAAQDANSMVRNIVLMLFSAVDRLLAAPGAGICSTLPALAWYINSGKLSEAVKSLTDPLALRIGVVTIPGITSLLGSIANLQGMDISSMMGGLDVIKLTGGDNATLKLPEMDMAALAACGSEKDGVFTPDRPAALITVTGWLVKTLKLNADAFTARNADAAKLIQPLLEKSDDELVKAILLLLGESRGSFTNPFKWTYNEYKSDEILSTPNLTMDDYAVVLEKIDPFLNEVAAEKDPDATIADTIRPLIYSNSLLGTVTGALYGALSGEEAAAMLPILGLDASPAGVASAIAGSHYSAAQTLRGLSSWDQLTANAIDFGFENGDREGFQKALSDVFAPFAPIFRYLFAEGQLTILGGVTLEGADGYNSVVIPILEALGCPPASIKTYAQYKETADSGVLTDIFTPIFALLDQICETPVKTVCAKLPNIVYFLYNDGLKNCLSNLLYPITAKLDQVGLSGVISGDLLDTSALDVDSAVDKLLNSADLQIKLVKPNLRRLQSFGTQRTLVSKRTADGSETVYTYIEANSPAVLLTVLRYLVNTLSLEENADVLSSFMTSMMAKESDEEADPDQPDMMAMYAGSIGEKFKDMSTDEIIEWLYDLLFRETPPVEPEDDYIPTIIYEKEKTHHPAVVIAVIAALLVLAFLVLRYLDKRNKFDKLKEKRAEKRAAKLAAKNEKRVAAGKPPKEPRQKKPKPEKKQKKQAKAADGTQPERQKKKKLTPEEKKAAKKAAKDAAIEEKLRNKAMKKAKKPAASAAAATAPAGKTSPSQPAHTPQLSRPVTQRQTQAAYPQQRPQAPQMTQRPQSQAYPRQNGTAPQTARQPSAPRYAPGAPAGDRYPAAGTRPSGGTPAAPQHFEASVVMSSKRAEQLNKAQAKAAREAQKNQAKTERIYAKAIKEANKNNPKGGRR